MKIYVIFTTIYDDEFHPYDELVNDLAFTTEKQAQDYINKQVNPKRYSIYELELIGELNQ